MTLQLCEVLAEQWVAPAPQSTNKQQKHKLNARRGSVEALYGEDSDSKSISCVEQGAGALSSQADVEHPPCCAEYFANKSEFSFRQSISVCCFMLKSTHIVQSTFTFF